MTYQDRILTTIDKQIKLLPKDDYERVNWIRFKSFIDNFDENEVWIDDKYQDRLDDVNDILKEVG